MKRYLTLILILLATACSRATPTPAPTATLPPSTATPPQVPLQAAELPTRVLPRADFGQYRQSVPPDGIPPIYEPTFVPADEAPLQENELVIGVEIELQARAYPVSVLRFREMVNDEVAGTPILVSW